MKTGEHIRAALTVLVVLTLAAGQNPQPQSTPLPVGSATVGQVKGEVTLRSPQGSPLTAQRGLVLGPESIIETAKGSILLDLEDDSQVLVKPHSHIVLKAPNQDKGFSLELLIGKIIAKVHKRLGDTRSFRMGTPTAAITVRGTHFSVEVTKKNRTIVEVFEGLVQAEGLGGAGQPVLIKPGFSTRVEQDRAPEQPQEMHDRGKEMEPDSSREGEHPSREGEHPNEDQTQNKSRPENEPH